MAKSVSLNRTDSAVSGVSSLSLPISVLNYGADWAVKSNATAKAGEVIITNLTTPSSSLPEMFRIALTDVKDVYKNTGIDPTVYAPSKRGVSLLCQLTDTWTVTDSVDTSYHVDLPIEGHIVLKLPANENITAGMVLAFVERLIAGLLNTGVITPTRLTSMLRGSLLPSDMRG